MNEYIRQAQRFLNRSGAALKIELVGRAINKDWGGNDFRNLYNVTLTTSKGKFRFDFWDSIYNTERDKEPTAYDILACLTKYDPGTFEDFCSEFGYDYDEDSRSAERIYFAAQKEYSQLSKLFTEKQMEELQEIE